MNVKNACNHGLTVHLWALFAQFLQPSSQNLSLRSDIRFVSFFHCSINHSLGEKTPFGVVNCPNCLLWTSADGAVTQCERSSIQIRQLEEQLSHWILGGSDTTIPRRCGCIEHPTHNARVHRREVIGCTPMRSALHGQNYPYGGLCALWKGN